MKKTYNLGCTKKCPVEEFLYMNSYRIHIHTCEFIYEFMYENSFYEFIYVNPQNMNSYMKSYTNKHNMAVRVSRFKIWQSGWSGSERRRRLRLWRCGSGKSLSQWGGCGEQRQAAALSEWDGPRRVTGPRRLRRAVASDGGPRRVTTVAASGRWRRATAGDGGPLLVTRAAASETGGGEWWTAGSCEWLGPGRMSLACRCAWWVTRVRLSSTCCASRAWVTGQWGHGVRVWLWLRRVLRVFSERKSPLQK